MRRVRDRVFSPESDPLDWGRALADANVPDRYQRGTLDGIIDARAREWTATTIQRAPDWMGAGIGFFLHGPKNTGKSSLAGLLLMEALRRCARCLWLPIRDVPKARFRDGDEGKALDRKLQLCELLVIDDLGQEHWKLSGAAGTALEDTVRIVYDHEGVVIVTSNFHWSAFRRVYGDAAAGLVSVLERIVHPVEITMPYPEGPHGQ